THCWEVPSRATLDADPPTRPSVTLVARLVDQLKWAGDELRPQPRSSMLTPNASITGLGGGAVVVVVGRVVVVGAVVLTGGTIVPGWGTVVLVVDVVVVLLVVDDVVLDDDVDVDGTDEVDAPSSVVAAGTSMPESGPEASAWLLLSRVPN